MHKGATSLASWFYGRHSALPPVLFSSPSRSDGANRKQRKVRGNSRAEAHVVDDRQLPLTEQINPSTSDLDRLGTFDLLHRINDEDRRAAWAVEREIDVIATAVDEIVKRVRGGGKLHYFGAGTSGRVGIIDAAEIPPTFSASGVVVAHIAGGAEAMVRPVEAAEDDAAAGGREAAQAQLSSTDAVIGLSASGTAAYVIAALETAKAAGALTLGLTNNPQGPLARIVDIPVVLRTGPEVLSGSTRMKAGSAQKFALTMISTAVMVKLGKVYGNLMVDLHASNQKLRDRAERITARISEASAQAVREALESTRYRVKPAVVILKRKCSASEADALLARHHGDLRAILDA